TIKTNKLEILSKFVKPVNKQEYLIKLLTFNVIDYKDVLDIYFALTYKENTRANNKVKNKRRNRSVVSLINAINVLYGVSIPYYKLLSDLFSGGTTPEQLLFGNNTTILQ